MATDVFQFSTVAHLRYPAGRVATDLPSLREGVAQVPAESLFFHVTRVALRHPRARDLPPNDFANWTAAALQDPRVAERLAFAGAQPLLGLEDQRASLLKILDDAIARRPAETVSQEAAFQFMSARSVTAPLPLRAERPEQVARAWPHLDAAAVFYHLIEARVLGHGRDDLILWLRERGAKRLAASAEELTMRGLPLHRLRREIDLRWRHSLIPARLVERTDQPEAARREEAHAVVARFARRLRKPPEGLE